MTTDVDNLQAATDSQGSIVECAMTIPIHFTDAARIMQQVFHMPDHGKYFKLFKTVGTLQGACRTLQDDTECLYGSCRLPQITTGIVPTFISVDNRDHKSAQCDWGLMVCQCIKDWWLTISNYV